MTSQERIRLALSLQEPDRVPIHDSIWETTVRRWHKEGLPEEQTPDDYFKFEIVQIYFDLSLQIKEEKIEETDDYIVIRTGNGALRKDWKNMTSTPEMVDFTVKNKDDWFRLKKKMVMNDKRIDLNLQKKIYNEAKRKGKFICLAAAMGYDYTQSILGTEKLLITLAEDPEWANDIFVTLSDMIIKAAERFRELGFSYDGINLFDDMGYRNSTLFSPETYKNVLFPAHKNTCDYFRSRNIPIILHSCGCVKSFIPFFIELGISCLEPLEVKAGMDVIELKKKYGKEIAFM
ncbi:uroporphyrinogen decarboxylase family protein, partial [candidate division KSB1 bacterium]